MWPGVSSKFQGWRGNQWDAVGVMMSNEEPVLALCCPTGFGKSLMYVGAAKLSGNRSVILTRTKALQDQLMDDFGSMPEVACIKGRNAYECVITGAGADSGPCSYGLKCDDVCEYKMAMVEARNAGIVITNYAYWTAKNMYGGGIGKFVWVVCDEAHSLPQVISDSISININTKHPELVTRKVKQEAMKEISDWVTWGRSMTRYYGGVWGELRRRVEGGDTSKDLMREMRQVHYGYNLSSQLSTLDPEHWVMERVGHVDGIYPVRIKGNLDKVIRFGSPHVILTSATLPPRMMDVLGVKGTYKEWEHSFPLVSRRLIHIPTVRVNYKMSDGDKRLWVSRMDQIMDGRKDGKGIIHSVSYDRAEYIAAHSRNRGRMLVMRRGENAANVIRDFKTDRRPLVLVSPVVGEGYDFPYDECRWQIVTKIPYPDTRGVVIQARMEEDDKYANFLAMQALIQMCGRGVRSETDFCENFVVDDNIGWFMKQNKDCAPNWFQGSLVRMNTIPRRE